jgi:OOP family OmpA-OmpF porin
MKKIVLPFLFFCLGTLHLSAQEEGESVGSNDFNRWSVEANGGFSKAANPVMEGYNIKAFNLFHADLGFRYMLNTKFGFKLEGGYDVLNADGGGGLEDTQSTLIRIGLQGYANLGRIMEFEHWTQRLNLLGHMGVGVGQLSNGDFFDGQDNIGNFLIGLTGQYRISDRVVLNADFTMINSFAQQRNWDGTSYDRGTKQGFDSTLYNASLGLTVYFGKHQKHADWFIDEKSDDLEELEDRIGELETMMNDSDKDGVPDYLDAEPNTITGVAVDSKGRTIDRNENGIPDELESYIETRDTELRKGISSDIADLINSGYINVYFDFNKDQPNAQSVNGINFLVKYLKDNPTVSADVIGYADEVGNTTYNQELSRRRAENVKQILVDSGIEASRLNIVGNGEDASVNKDSKYARQVVRRVTFILKN